MKIFATLLLIVFSAEIFAFSGQPKEIEVMSSLGVVTRIHLDEVFVSDLVLRASNKYSCEFLAKATAKKMVQVGNFDFEFRSATARIDRDSDCSKVEKLHSISFSLREFGMTLDLILPNRFANVNSSNSVYKVISTY
jgi:hypothetical protein